MKRVQPGDAAPPTSLTLAVQYATARSTPPRERVRYWVRATLRQLERASDEDGAAVVASADLTVRFVDEAEGWELNRRYRHKDHATNVLTFSYGGGGAEVAADIVICAPVVEAEALAQRKSLVAHTTHLIVHGTLHACGYDHEDADDAARMEAIERRVLARFKVADPYREVDAEHDGGEPPT